MKRKENDKQIIYQLIFTDDALFYNRDGELIEPKIDVLSTVIQKIFCDSSLEQLGETLMYPIEDISFYKLYNYLKKSGYPLKTEPIYHKGAIYYRKNAKKKRYENIILLNSIYEKDNTDYHHTYVIAPVKPMDTQEKYQLDGLEEIEILHRAFKYEYILEYEYVDSESFQYDFASDKLVDK